MVDGASTTGVQAAETGTDAGPTNETNSVAETQTPQAEVQQASSQPVESGGQDAGVTDTGVETGSEGPAVPDTYADFNLPKDMPLDDALLTEATPLFKELGLTQEQAQKLVDFQAKQVQASSQKQTDSFNQLMQEWVDQSKKDSEFGGDKFEESVASAKAAVSKFGTPELAELLEGHGLGNHPEVIRFMVRVGKFTAEDVPGAASAPVSKAQDRVNLLYPNDRNGA